MPLYDNFWDSFYSGMGIDPLAEDRENRLNSFSTTFTPQYRGLEDSQLDVWGTADDSALNRIGSSFLGTFHSGIGSILDTGADLFDRAQNTIHDFAMDPVSTVRDIAYPAINRTNEALDFLTGGLVSRAGVQPLPEPDAQQYEPTTDVGTFARRISEQQNLLAENRLQAAQIPFEAGGGLVDEFKAGELGVGEVAEFIGQQAANMGAMALLGAPTLAAGGPTAEMGVFQRALMNSYAANSFSNTYNDLIDDGASVQEALTRGASNAVVQTALENIGWESMFGGGAAKLIGKAGWAESRIANAVLRGSEAALTEGSEEYLQNIMDIMARRTDLASAPDWAEAFQKAAADPSSIESFWGGAVFGGPMGGFHGALNPAGASVSAELGAKDTSARHGGNVGSGANLDASVGNGQVTGQDKALGALVGTLEQAIQNPGEDVTPQITSIAEAAKAGEAKRQEALLALQAEAEVMRADIASRFTPESAVQFGNMLSTAVERAGQDAASRVQAVQGVWEQLSGKAQNAQEQVPVGESEGTLNMEPVQPASREELLQAVAMSAVQNGVNLSFEQLMNPETVNWQEVAQQHYQEATQAADKVFAPIASHLVDSVSVPEDSALHRISNAKALPVAPAVDNKVLRRTQGLPYTPDLSALVVGSKVYGKLKQLASTDDLAGTVTPEQVTNAVSRAYMVKPERLTQNTRALIEEATQARNQLATADLKPLERIDLSDHYSLLVNQIEQSMVDVVVPRWNSTGANIEATNARTRLASYTASEDRTKDMRKVLLGKVDKAAKKAGKNAGIPALLTEEKAAESYAPLVKKVLSSIHQLGTQDEKLFTRGALTLDKPMFTDAEFGAKVKEHMKRVGWSDVLDGLSDEAVGANMRSIGKGIMSPWGLERIMLEVGTEPDVVNSAMAAMSAMADRWSAKNNSGAWEFYDRLGDRAVVVEALRSVVLGTGQATNPINSRRGAISRAALRYGRGAVELFKGKRNTPTNFTTFIHEVTHLLETSGLLVEMLDDEALAAMEKHIGAKLRSSLGDPLPISREAQEKLAMSMERFLYDHAAPNPALAAAFQDVKNYLGSWIREVLGQIGVSIHALTKREAWGKVDESGSLAYNFDGVTLKWGDVALDAPTVRAFYMLFNSNPDGSAIEYVSGGGSPGLSAAIELEASLTTGLNADGWITSPPAKPLASKVSSSMPSWRERVGLVNEDANGTFYEEGLRALEDVKRDVEKWDATPMPPASVSPQKAANKAVQNALATQGSLADSTLLEEKLEAMGRAMISGNKDIHLAGGTPRTIADRVSSLTTFTTSLIKWGLEFPSASNKGQMLKALKERVRSSTWKGFKSVANMLEHSQANLGAQGQELYTALGLPLYAEQFNNQFALRQLANRVIHEVPSVTDPVTTEPVPIKGLRSFVNIMASLARGAEAMWESKHKNLIPGRTLEQFQASTQRDVAIYMVAQRQLEIDKRAKALMSAYEKASQLYEAAGEYVERVGADGLVVRERTNRGEAPKRPKIPNVDPKATVRAESAIALLDARYGKDIAILDNFSLEFSRWESRSKLDQLLAANMITQESYNNMMRDGERYIPLKRIHEALKEAGAVNLRVDESMYNVLEYLRGDTAGRIENPIDQGIKSVQAVTLLVHRQHGRNVLGNAILKDFDVWNSEKHGITVYSKEVDLTKEEWDRISKEQAAGKNMHARLYSKLNKIKDESGKVLRSEMSYHAFVPVQSADMEEHKNKLREILKKMAKKHKGETLTEQDVEALMDRNTFAFYPEPGKPMYIYVSDPDLAKSLFSMNNPQAVYAASYIGRLKKLINDPAPDENLADSMKRFARKAQYATLFGYGSLKGSLITRGPKFLAQAIFRDLIPSVARSRHGLGFSIPDFYQGLRQSNALLFPSLREIDPEKYAVAQDASMGMAAFSGIVSNQLGQQSHSDTIFRFSWGRDELMERARGGDKSSKRQLLWNDFRNFMASNGVLYTPAELIKNLADGKNIAKNAVLLAKSPWDAVMVTGGFVGALLENTRRIQERAASMSEDMSQFPQLLRFYDTSEAGQVGGKVRAGFEGSRRFNRVTHEESRGVMGQLFGASHKAEWERQKKLMEEDPNYVPPVNTLPVQYRFAERDYSMRHVTIAFDQHGSASHTLNKYSLFYNPGVQDSYTSLKFLTDTSAVRKALYAWSGGEGKYAPLANQHKYDARALKWVLSNFAIYTLGAAAQVALYSGDDDESKKWRAQRFIEKMSYWHIPIGGGKSIRIANGLGIGALFFHDLPMAAWMEIQQEDPQAMSKWMQRFYDVTPLGFWTQAARGFEDGGLKEAGRQAIVNLPESLKPMAEAQLNYDTFRNKPIEYPEGMAANKQDPTEIARERYSAVQNMLAKQLGVQPKVAAHLIDAYLPGVSAALPDLLNRAIEGTPLYPPDVGPSNRPFLADTQSWMPRYATPNPWGMQSESVQDVFNTLEKSTMYKNSLEDMEPSRKPGYLKQHPLGGQDVFNSLSFSATAIRNGEAYAKLVEKGTTQNSQIDSLPPDVRAKMALDLRREYSLLAHETMKQVINTIGGI